jgi:hypothetical protein
MMIYHHANRSVYNFMTLKMALYSLDTDRVVKEQSWEGGAEQIQLTSHYPG